MATTGDSRGGGADPGGGKNGSVGRQMVPQWDKRAGGKGRGQRHVDVSDDLEESSSFQHSGSEEQKRTGEQSEEQNHQKKALNRNPRVVNQMFAVSGRNVSRTCDTSHQRGRSQVTTPEGGGPRLHVS